MCDKSGKKEEQEMATETLCKHYTINEEEANLILNTKPIKIKESGIFNDLNLSKRERLAHAASILNSRKKCR